MTEITRQHGQIAPTADQGLVTIYAQRVLERGADPRTLVAESRAVRWGYDRPLASIALTLPTRSIGRGTPSHNQRASHRQPRVDGQTHANGQAMSAVRQKLWPQKPVRRVVIAGLAALIALPVAFLAAGAEEVGTLASFQTRYVVQPGDTLDAVATEFGVNPAAILASSAIANAPAVSPNETIVIPTPNQTPAEAVVDAADRQGTSPYVLGAYTIGDGDTIGSIAYWHHVDPLYLADFNGVADFNNLQPGERLLIPASFGLPGSPEELGVGGGSPTFEDAQPTWDEESSWAAASEEAAGPAPVLIEGVPNYLQRYNLSCEYAAAYIATATFGNPIDEDVFRANVGESANPHWGYRGWIEGDWGNTDDYGVYPEALVPTLEAYGFVADVFYAQGDANALTSRLDAGMPVEVWLGYFGDTGMTLDDDGTYRVAAGTHVLVAYGYDAGGVHLSDPGTGTDRYLSWGEFMTMWSVLDGMALGIAPM